MSPLLYKLLRSSKGISIIALIILAAIAFAGMNVYAYFNPDFSLRKYSLVTFLASRNDETRKADLKKIQAAIENYYDENGQYPADDGWCGRIVSVLHSEAKDAIGDYFGDDGIPQDPAFRGTNKDYFYRREDRNAYVLMVVLEKPPPGSTTYSYGGCYNWPGNDVYNYQIQSYR